MVSYTSDREVGWLQCKRVQEQGAFQQLMVEWILEDVDSTMLSDTVWLQGTENIINWSSETSLNGLPDKLWKL